MEAIAKSKAGGVFDVECWRLNDPKTGKRHYYHKSSNRI